MAALPEAEHSLVSSPDLRVLPNLLEIDRHPLSLKTEGRVHEWFQALQQKRLWTEANDPRADTVHVELDLAGGGMQGVMHVGLLSALASHNLLPYIDRVVGVSTGILAAVTAYGMNDKRAKNAYPEIAQEGIVSPRRMPLRRVIDLPRLDTKLRGLNDFERVRHASTQLSCIVTNVETGKAEHINVTGHPDPLRPAIASAAVPGISNAPVALKLPDGRTIHGVDGMISSPFPQSKDESITHRLVVVPYPTGGDMAWLHRLYMAVAPRLLRYPNARKAIMNLNIAWKRDLANIHADIEGRQPNTGLVCPNEVIGALTQDWQNVLSPYQLRAEDAYAQLIGDALSQIEPVPAV